MAVTTGLIYVTICERKIGAYGDNQFKIVRASSTRGQPGPGEVEVPIRITLDRAWFTRRTLVVRVTLPDPVPVSAALGSER